MNENLGIATSSYLTFAKENERIEQIILYLKISNELVNKHEEETKSRLIALNEELEIPYPLNNKKKSDFLDLGYYENTLSSMMYVKAIDNFIAFFKDILSEVIISNPSILKSSESEKLEYILSHNSLEHFIKSVTEKKVNSLFYAGIKDIQKYFHDKLNIEIFKDNYYSINLLIKQRNLAVHNRGKISKEFNDQFPKENLKVGMYLNFQFDYVGSINTYLYRTINELEAKIAQKYKLKQKNFYT